jgi:hypothetical protein
MIFSVGRTALLAEAAEEFKGKDETVTVTITMKDKRMCLEFISPHIVPELEAAEFIQNINAVKFFFDVPTRHTDGKPLEGGNPRGNLKF